MQAEFAFAILRNFAVMTAMLLVIKNLAWCGELLAVHLHGGDYREFSHKVHTTDEWIIRAGSVLIAIGSFFALILAAASHVLPWLNATNFVNPFAFIAIICFETLMVWRLLFFTKRAGFMYASLACLAALSILVEFAQ